MENLTPLCLQLLRLTALTSKGSTYFFWHHLLLWATFTLFAILNYIGSFYFYCQLLLLLEALLLPALTSIGSTHLYWQHSCSPACRTASLWGGQCPRWTSSRPHLEDHHTELWTQVITILYRHNAYEVFTYQEMTWGESNRPGFYNICVWQFMQLSCVDLIFAPFPFHFLPSPSQDRIPRNRSRQKSREIEEEIDIITWTAEHRNGKILDY